MNSVQSNLSIEDISKEIGTVVRKTFDKGERIYKIEGEIFCSGTNYTIQTGEAEFTHPKNGKFIGHSCEPNCFFDHKTKYFVALQQISKGSRLNYNYNTTEYCMEKPFICRCGSLYCYGTISGYKYLNMRQKKRIENFIPEYFKKK